MLNDIFTDALKKSLYVFCVDKLRRPVNPEGNPGTAADITCKKIFTERDRNGFIRILQDEEDPINDDVVLL